jgi:hypothetical protein
MNTDRPPKQWFASIGNPDIHKLASASLPGNYAGLKF